MDGEGTAFTVREERNRGCDSIRALALACPYPIHRRRTAGDRQQRGRKGAARCSSWTEKLPIRRFRLRWRTCRRDVQPDRIGQAERSRSGVLPAHCLVPDPGPPHQPHRGAPALDRKSTRLNSSHLGISYAVFCFKKRTRERGSLGRAAGGAACLGRRRRSPRARFGPARPPPPAATSASESATSFSFFLNRPANPQLPPFTPPALPTP